MNIIYHNNTDPDKVNFTETIKNNVRTISLNKKGWLFKKVKKIKDENKEASIRHYIASDEKAYLFTFDIISSINQNETMLLVTIHKTGDSSENFKAGLLQRLYDFTVVEEKISLFLLNGKSLKEISSLCNISYEHTRQRLKIIFSKTQTKSQAQLVSKLSKDIFAVPTIDSSSVKKL